MKPNTKTIRFTKIELEAAFLACSNYTPCKGGWKQAAQTRVVRKLQQKLLDFGGTLKYNAPTLSRRHRLNARPPIKGGQHAEDLVTRQPERTTMDTIIFDIDGTLADVEHRRHHLSGAKPAWGKFFDEMVNDPPLRDVCLLAELLGDHPLVNQGAIKLFLFSGRPETHRKETEDWLNIHARSYFQKAEALLMRGEGDYRADTIVKKEMLRSIEAQGYDVRLVVDDRPSVVEMWKAEGLTVLAHDSGEWDGIQKTWDTGELHMMVGPSGAGKSTYIKNNAWLLRGTGAVISSDTLRIEIAGTLRDMSINDQVFSVMHALTRARLTGGLKTVIDATNLRSRDRRSLRDCAPPDTEIFYHVIDRPLADKHRDAGWRDDVVIKGVKLIDKHAQTFKSTVKAILAGDDDTRVTVYDHRRFE